MELIETGDGSLTLRHEQLGELYHSDRGAVGEAEHVYIRAGFDAVIQQKEEIAVFEVGFGSGLNCYLTYRQALANRKRVDYSAIDLYPIGVGTARQLHYTDDPVFLTLHELPWDGERHAVDGDRFSLTKYRADLSTFDFSALAERFDVVYFDAFAPDVQPGLWSEAIMHRLFYSLKPEGVWVSYSAKGAVKQALRAAGFEVFRLPGALGKRHMLRAVKSIKQSFR